MPPKDKYADPELRDQVKQEIHEGDKGGQSGQWSARKAQMMAKEYKKRGGEYNTDKSEQDESQKNLSKWGEEEWQTRDGSGDAKQDNGTEKRYLPKEAWENMTEKEKDETEREKDKGSKEGKQFVQNTDKAKASRQKVNEKEDEKFEKRKAAQKNDKSKGDDADEDDVEAQSEEVDEAQDSEAEYQDDGDAEDDQDGGSEDDGEDDNAEKQKSAKTGQKRKQGDSKQSNGSSKKQKSEGNDGNAPKGKIGSKHMDAEEPAPRGSADRLPKKGDSITWKAMPGYVEGKVVEVLTSGKKVDGKQVKASEKDPKIVMESSSSGKICVHKPDACFYE